MKELLLVLLLGLFSLPILAEGDGTSVTDEEASVMDDADADDIGSEELDKESSEEDVVDATTEEEVTPVDQGKAVADTPQAEAAPPATLLNPDLVGPVIDRETLGQAITELGSARQEVRTPEAAAAETAKENTLATDLQQGLNNITG
tara:strand:- start:15100 stop:15540 length:441 start_codon:yes stop_codon:yes gene_type:complete